MKIKILFVQESLHLAGSEKSMVTLLKNLNQQLYEIDVQLMSYGGELEKELPSEVNLLPPLAIKKYMSKPLFKHFLSIRSKLGLKLFFARLHYSSTIRKEPLKHSEKAELFWRILGKLIPVNKKEYDVAIGFAQGFPTFYVADKTIAAKKLCWINANMNFDEKHKEFQSNYYQQFDHVVCITPQNEEHIKQQLPQLKNTIVLENIVDFNAIRQASNAKKIQMSNKLINILTVSRLEKHSKGMDIALEAVRSLRKITNNFHWYFLGDGEYRKHMQSFIHQYQLDDYVTLLGTDPNPYPFFKAADIYVQTSRHEGFGRTIAEARLLNLPVVTTKFDTVHQQIRHEENGIIAELNGKSVATSIFRLMEDKSLYKHISDNLKKEPKQNLESIKKFDELMRI